MRVFDNDYNNWIKSLENFINDNDIDESSKTMTLYDDFKILNEVNKLNRPLTGIEVNNIVNGEIKGEYNYD
jgi:hypothetical protein